MGAVPSSILPPTWMMPFLTYMSISGRWPKVLPARPPVTSNAWVVLKTGHPMQFSQHTYFSMNLSSEVLKSCGKFVLLIAQRFGIKKPYLDVLEKKNNLEQKDVCYRMCWQNIKKIISSDVLAEKWCVFCFFYVSFKKHSQHCGFTPLEMRIFLHLVRLHEQWSVRLRPPVKVEVFSRERQIFFVRLPYQKIVVEQNAIQWDSIYHFTHI